MRNQVWAARQTKAEIPTSVRRCGNSTLHGVMSVHQAVWNSVVIHRPISPLILCGNLRPDGSMNADSTDFRRRTGDLHTGVGVDSRTVCVRSAPGRAAIRRAQPPVWKLDNRQQRAREVHGVES